MNGKELHAHLQDLGIEIELDGDNLKVRARPDLISPELRDMLTSGKPELVAHLRAIDPSGGSRSSLYARAPRDGKLPLSFVQQQLWFLDRLEGGKGYTYNVPTTYRMTGAVRPSLIRQTLDELYGRHEILRARIGVLDGEPVHLIGDHKSFPLTEVDLSSSEDPERDLQPLLEEVVGAAFDLMKGPLCRATLFRIGAEKYVLGMCVHHIITDGWSGGVFESEFKRIYSALARNERPQLPNLRTSFLDYASHEQNSMRGEALEGELGYWTRKLATADHVLELPSDRARPDVTSFRGGRHGLRIEGETVAALMRLSRESGATPYMTMLAVFAMLLQRHSGKDDLLVGTPFANRGHAELESVIGFFVNTVVVRTDLTGDPTFRELLGRIRGEVFDVHEHVRVPMEQLIKRLNVPADLSRNPLFQVVFSMEGGSASGFELPGVDVERLFVDRTASKFDLLLKVIDKGDYWWCHADYSLDLFDAETVERFCEQFVVLARRVVENPDAPISEISPLSNEEIHRLVVEWNDTATTYPSDRSIKALFEEVVRTQPEAPAIRFGDEAVSYEELNRRANRLASELLDAGVGRDSLVGICARRSVELIVGLLATLKAGAGYVPLDPDYPRERLSYLIEDSAPVVILTQGRLESAVPAGDRRVVSLDRYALPLTGSQSPNPAVDASPSGLAYVIYTSGSTGRPKGVEVENRAVVRLVRDTTYLRIGPEDVVLLHSPTTFDASVFEIWGALLNGATLAVAPPNRLSLGDLGGVLQRMNVSVAFITSGLFRLMVDERCHELAGLRCLITGGDVMSPVSAKKLRASLPDLTLINAYGPTECTVFAAFREVGAEDAERIRVPIGHPVSNTTAYVLDAKMHPVPVGVPGELYLGGPGLARGYRGRPELTQAAFVTNPFSGDPAERLYRTGDRCKRLPDGAIDFLGRFDDQIKIRGFRIEPAETEATLNGHEAVRESLVLAQPDKNGEKALVAYALTGEHSVPTESLMEFLSERLPSYLMPGMIVCLERFPRTQNGKIDRAALENPLLSQVEAFADARPPSTSVEKALSEIWERVLGGSAYTLDDDFFMLGGHSLLALKVVARIEERFGVTVTIRAIFENATLEELSGCVSSALEAAGVNPDREPAARMTI